jgi:hypothetical protein
VHGSCLGAGAGTPYAMHDIDQASMYTRNGHSFHMQETSKQLPDKVGCWNLFHPIRIALSCSWRKFLAVCKAALQMFQTERL